MEFDHLVVGQIQFRGLDPAVGRVAVGEQPLLRDHLHRQLRAFRHGQRVRPAARAGAVVGLQAHGPEHGDREHHQRGDDDPGALHARVAAHSRAFQHAALWLAEEDHGVDQVEQHQRQHGRRPAGGGEAGPPRDRLGPGALDPAGLLPPRTGGAARSSPSPTSSPGPTGISSPPRSSSSGSAPWSAPAPGAA